MKKCVAFLFAAVLGIGAGLVVSSSFEITSLADETMAPMYQKGQHMLVDRFFQKEKSFQRGDVVLFTNFLYKETGEGDTMVKRIIGLPGEWVSIVNGRVYINDEPLDETAYGSPEESSIDLSKRCVPFGRYFVLGDNRSASTDSRDETVGMVRETDIEGKVILQW